MVLSTYLFFAGLSDAIGLVAIGCSDFVSHAGARVGIDASIVFEI